MEPCNTPVRVMFCWAALIAPAAVCGASAQTSARTQADSDSLGAESADRPAAVQKPGADEALRTAREILDALDRGNGQSLSREDLQTLSRCAETIRGADSGNPWLYYLTGRLMALKGRPGDAITAMRTFVESADGRNNWRAHKVLGDFYVNGYPQLAQSQYREADALNKDDPGVLYGLSLCAVKLGRTEEAAELADRAVAADGGKTLRFVTHLARILASRGEWDQAVRRMQEGVKIARAAIESKPGEQAPCETFDRHLSLFIDITRGQLKESPSNAELHIRLADLIGQRAENRRTIARFEEREALQTGIEATSPNTPLSLKQQYAISLAETGRPDEAVAVFKEILASDPTNEKAQEWLAGLQSKKPASSPAP